MIIDSGILYAAIDADDDAHEAALTVLRRPEPKIVPEPVVVEVSWLVERRLGSLVEAAFLGGLSTGREGGAEPSGSGLVVEAIREVDRVRAADLIGVYADAGLGYVDASVVAVAERLHDVVIATLDRRDFSIVRPRHTDAFELIP